ncbi:hypothetical protein ACFORG_16970 [Lutimaribacter marinistellae]|uniref:Uncharacterized protein n=1 Tax=Lutimaribacter marinistellae TaxID=1820329 RepID=A0ABV7TIP5_9RHOB
MLPQKTLTDMRKLLLSALALAILPACETIFHTEGVGFTGIDGEPRTIADAPSAVSVTRGVNIPAALATRPTIRVQVDASDMSDLAAAAISAGGRTPLTAVEVGGMNRTLMLSNVQANNVLFAVLRSPEGETTEVGDGSEAAFAAAVPRLTGCLAVGQTYRAGSARNGGLAVPLNCR